MQRHLRESLDSVVLAALSLVACQLVAFPAAWQAVRPLSKPALSSSQPAVEVVSRVAAAVSAHTAPACNASAPDMMKLAT